MSDLFLPQYRDVEVVTPGTRTGKGGNPHHYLIDGVRHTRITTPLNIISKPGLIPWHKRLALEKVRAVLTDRTVQEELMRLIDERAWTDSMSPEYNGWVDRLIHAASDAPDEVRDASAALGTEVHSLISDILKSSSSRSHLLAHIANNSEFMEVSKEQRPAVRGALAFIVDYRVTVLETELTVWSEAQGIAGTLDGVGRNDGGELIIWDWKRSAGIYWETALQLSAYGHCLEELMGERVKRSYAVRLLRQPPEPDEPLYEAKALKYPDGGWGSYISAQTLHQASKEKWWE